MVKTEELNNPQSCLNRAAPDEMLFVLLSRDIAAPATIRTWVSLRIGFGKNKPDDPQIKDALECAKRMEEVLAASSTIPAGYLRCEMCWPPELVRHEEVATHNRLKHRS